MPKGIDKLIINSPYDKPTQHWKYNRDKLSFELIEGRREAGYIIATPDSQSFDDPGIFRPLDLVNKIRPRLDKWREDNYPGVTGITRKLLEHWNDKSQRAYPLFFCQLEAIETLVWLIETPASEKTGINIPKDGGEFVRLCSKMGTGSGKTILLAMILAWNILNKNAYKQDTRFSSNALIVAPSITVRNRLQVLMPDSVGNYYDQFHLVPDAMKEPLRQSIIKIINWHLLLPLDDDTKKKGVVKKGAESDYAFVSRVLGKLSKKNNLIVINDEAHHAWRERPELKISKAELEERFEEEEITRWIEGLDRIHKVIGILNCFDVTATPFSPTGKKSDEEGLFGWIVSDFGLNDSIESGLVKTPRVVIKDDGTMTKELKSKFYHLYPHVREELQRAEETVPLPDLVVAGYNILGADWAAVMERWSKENMAVPPVLFTVCNRVDTAKRIEYSFRNKKIKIEELCKVNSLLRVDSKVYEEAEAIIEKEGVAEVKEREDDESELGGSLSKKDQKLLMREQVDTVGQPGKPGSHIHNVISVAMVSEGWDARNVTHIMGLRAFSSQLLCEQVVGRGLRRMSYDMNDAGRFEAEYVNIFGIPFTFLPFEGGDDTPPTPPQPKTYIEIVKGRDGYEIKIPNIDRIDTIISQELVLDEKAVPAITLSIQDTPMIAQLAPVVDGKPDVDAITIIDLRNYAEKYRIQKLIFEVARDIIDNLQNKWKGSKEDKIHALFGFVERFIKSGKVRFRDYATNDELRQRLLLALNMRKIVEHLTLHITSRNKEQLNIIFNLAHPIISTKDMSPWWSSKPCLPTKKSQVSHVVVDSTWEAIVSSQLEDHKNVKAYVKNDHIGLYIYYFFQGKTDKYIPDLIIKLDNGKTLVLEVKGVKNEAVERKNEFVKQWIEAVNKDGRFGVWVWDILYDPIQIVATIDKYVG